MYEVRLLLNSCARQLVLKLLLELFSNEELAMSNVNGGPVRTAIDFSGIAHPTLPGNTQDDNRITSRKAMPWLHRGVRPLAAVRHTMFGGN